MRLQTIKECDLVDVVVQAYRGEKVNIDAVTNDIKWLIEQAEKVEVYDNLISEIEKNQPKTIQEAVGFPALIIEWEGNLYRRT